MPAFRFLEVLSFSIPFSGDLVGSPGPYLQYSCTVQYSTVQYSTVPAHIVDISAHEVSQPVRHPESPRQVSSHHLIHAATQQPTGLQIPQDNPDIGNLHYLIFHIIN